MISRQLFTLEFLVFVFSPLKKPVSLVLPKTKQRESIILDLKMDYNKTLKALFTNTNAVRNLFGQIRPEESILITCDVVYGADIPLSVLSYIAPVMRLALGIPQAEVVMVMKPFLSEGYTFNEMQYGGMLLSSHFVQYLREHYPDIEHRVKVVLDYVSLSAIGPKNDYNLANVPTDEKECINWVFPNRPHDFDRIIRVDTLKSSLAWQQYLNLINKLNSKTCVVNNLISQVDQDPEEYTRCYEPLIYNSRLGKLYPYGLDDSHVELFSQINKLNFEGQRTRLCRNYSILLQDFAKNRQFYSPGRVREQILLDGYSQMQKFVSKWVQ